MGYLGFAIALIAVLGALFLAARWGGKSGMAIYSAGTLLLTVSLFATMGGTYDIIFADGLSMVGLLIGAFLLSMIIYFLKYGTKAGVKFGFKIGGMVIVYGLLITSIEVANNLPVNWYEALYETIALLALIITSTIALFGMLKLINKNKLKGILAFILLALVVLICTLFYYLVFGILSETVVVALTTCGISAIIILVEMILGYLVYLLATIGKKEVLPAQPYSAPAQKTEVQKTPAKIETQVQPENNEEIKEPVIVTKTKSTKKTTKAKKSKK